MLLSRHHPQQQQQTPEAMAPRMPCLEVHVDCQPFFCLVACPSQMLPLHQLIRLLLPVVQASQAQEASRQLTWVYYVVAAASLILIDKRSCFVLNLVGSGGDHW